MLVTEKFGVYLQEYECRFLSMLKKMSVKYAFHGEIVRFKRDVNITNKNQSVYDNSYYYKFNI